MDYLQIHDNRPLSVWEYKCILQLNNLLTTEDSFTFIRLPYFDNIIKTVNESDKIRYEWLLHHPNGIYIDTDCFLQESFNPTEKGKIFFPYRKNEKSLDVFYIIVNNDVEFIQNNFNQDARKKYIKSFPLNEQERFYGWPIELTRKMTGYGIIPDNCYKHTSQTMQLEHRRRVYGKISE